jgi:hypothetical protein
MQSEGDTVSSTTHQMEAIMGVLNDVEAVIGKILEVNAQLTDRTEIVA